MCVIFFCNSVLLRSRHFIGLLRSSTFEVFSNSPELLSLGQKIIDKYISDIRSQGQEIPNSDAQLIVTLEQYLSGGCVTVFIGTIKSWRP